MAKPYANGVILPASVAAAAPLRIPHGTAPSSPTDGDIWTTTAGVFARVNGSTKDLTASGGGGSTFDAITTSSGASTSPSLWGDVTTGDIGIGGGLTSGNIRLGSASQSGAIVLNPDQLYFGSANLKQMIFTGGPTHHSIELGRQDGTSSTPYIDFHSGATAVDSDVRLIASGGNGSNGQADFAIQSGSVALTGTLKPAAGTTSVPPIDFAAGSLLSTPVGGAMEFDGDTFYLTPDGSAVGGRAANLAAHFLMLTTARTLSNGSSAQSIFGKSLDVAASTLYEIEMEVLFTATAGGTAASVGLSFGGSATLTSIAYRAIAAHSATSGKTAASPTNMVFVDTASNTLVVPSGTNWYKRISVKGLIRVNAAGTFTPNATWSAAPGGAPSTAVGSYIKMTPMGPATASGGVVAVGDWS